MAITLKPGARLISAVCATEMIAVKAPPEPVDLTIGGAPPVASAAARDDSATVVDGHGGGSLMGKRYVDGAGNLELLCTRAGDGVPAVNGVVLHVKEAKPLPSSD